MAKFAIECPNCGNFVEGKTGFFAKKSIECACGYNIDIRTWKLATKECPHCGNQIVFDQTKGADAVCPICKQQVNTLADQQKAESFTCAQCGVKLITSRSASTYTCPVCDCVNDVQERLALEKVKNDGLASVIKYEGDNSTFIWKHPITDFNYGSQLIVHESQEAVFFRDGQALDLFGPGRYTLATQRLPMLDKIYQLPTDSDATFHSEVYFINKTVQMGIKWGTPDKVRFLDPLTGVPLELGASGEMNIQVSDSRKLLVKLVGTMKGISWEEGPGMTKSLQASFRPLITSAVKTNLSSVIKNEGIDLLEIDEKLQLISDHLREKMLPGFEEYGLTVPQFYVTNIVLPDDDPNFQSIRDLHLVNLKKREYQAVADMKVAQAESETLYRTAEEKSQAAIEEARRDAELQRQLTETEIAKRAAERKIIEAQAEAQAQRMAGLTEAEIMRAKGYSEKDVLQTEVQKAYAESIGNMGPVISSGGGSGVMGDILGLGVGMAAASAMAPQIGGMFQGLGIQNMNNTAAPVAPENKADTWDCTCGQKGIIGNFCNNCGARRPQPVAPDRWDCACGQKGIIGNFCNNCGARRPQPAVPETWDCTCGQKGIIGNFCNNCGKKKGE